MLMPKDIDEMSYQLLLKNTQLWVNMTGTIQCNKASDSFLRIICNYCFPKEIGGEMNHKHI